MLLERGKNLAELACDEMRELIRTGEWPPRSRLPSESDLSKRFGMSRPVIRQALARLREDGLIQSRQGSGSFVLGRTSETDAVPSVQFPTIGSLADLESFLNFREGVEGEAAAVAAARRTDAQLAELRAVASRIASERSSAELPTDDYAFHLAVAEASGNAFSVNTIMSLRSHLMLGLGLVWKFSAGKEDFRATVQTHHARIVDAIARRAPEEARAAMRDHLRWSRNLLLNGQS